MAKDSDRVGGLRAILETPITGDYRVWHKAGDEFIPVASVTTGNLLGALVQTMHRVDTAWQENDGVTAFLTAARSTDIGDVIVSPDGGAYQITATRGEGLVFDRIEFPQSREIKELFSEWKSDYTAASKRDVRALFADSATRSLEPSQPESENEKDRGGRD